MEDVYLTFLRMVEIFMVDVKNETLVDPVNVGNT